MRSTTLVSIFVCSVSAIQIPSRFSPFFSSSADEVLSSNDTALEDIPHELLKRANYCPANYNSCSTVAAVYAGACCTKSSVCTTDGNANIACCPTGATCTGTIASRTATAVITASYVANVYFPFPYLPTTYGNAAACTSAYSACQSINSVCTDDLTGGAFGVTISAIGGGVTVAPTATNVGSASASSICSSLSEEACRGLETSSCTQYGTATTTDSVFIVGSTNAAPRPTRMPGMVAGIVAGVGLGLAGQMI